MNTARTILLMVVLVLGACTAPSEKPQINLPAPYADQGVSVAADRLWRDAGGKVAAISGTAMNMSGRDLTHCQIRFDVLEQGTQETHAIAVINGLTAGQESRFEATFTPPFDVDFSQIVPGQIIVLPPPQASRPPEKL